MIILLCLTRGFKRNMNIKCLSFVLTCMTNLDKKDYMGACACVIVVLFVVGCCWGGVVCLWFVSMKQDNQKCKEIYIFCRAYARDTPGPPAFACNLDIFFSELVTCTHYGATYWDNLYR